MTSLNDNPKVRPTPEDSTAANGTPRPMRQIEQVRDFVRQPVNPRKRDTAAAAEGNGNGAPPTMDGGNTFDEAAFGQTAVYQQSRSWSRAIIWTIMLLSVGAVGFAAIAKIDEAVPAQGKLEPLAKVQDVQVPTGGVVKQVHVKDGQKVNAGDLLISMESAVPESQLASLRSIRDKLEAENRFYRVQMGLEAPNVQADSIQASIEPSILALTKSRNALIAENNRFRTELTGQVQPGANLTAEERLAIQNSQTELRSRVQEAQLQMAQVAKQIQENQVKRQGLVDTIQAADRSIQETQTRATAKVQQSDKQLQQNRVRKQEATASIEATKKSMEINTNILRRLQATAAEGAIAQVQVDQQQQRIIQQQQELIRLQSQVEQLDREYERVKLERDEAISAAKLEIQNLTQQNRNRANEVRQLDEQSQRLQIGTAEGENRITTTIATSRKDLLARIAENQKRIADIDGQVNKTILENQKRIDETNNQINQATQSLRYQEVRAPIAGTIFDSKINGSGFVANTSEPVMKIVPGDNLVARVFITNKDIGFIRDAVGKENQVDVRLDTYPFSEFGDIKGTLEAIGSDALPPDQTHPFYRFPARIRLAKQTMTVKGQERQLESGMSLSVNVRTRSRTVLSLFTEMFSRSLDSVKNVK
jgi:HlyD family secretion protein